MNEWRWPTPHEVLGGISATAWVLLSVGLFGHDSIGEKLCQAIGALGGLTGIGIAARHIPVRVQKILDDRDELITEALHSSPNGKAGGASER